MPRISSTQPLISELAKGVASIAELRAILGVSQPSLSRALSGLTKDHHVVRIGTTRGARYGLRRVIPDTGSSWPLYRVSGQGPIEELGVLHALAAGQYFIKVNETAKQPRVLREDITDGLPYFLQDQRPGGFLGRAVPGLYPELNLPPRVTDWTDDHYLRYLTRHGSDCVGDLILGEGALNEYLACQRRPSALAAAERELRYPELALEVMQGGLPGSSAHGEHPKFAVAVTTPQGPRPVLVKFSPSIGTPLGRRWSDLLIAEHHAHEVLGEAQLPACTSRLHAWQDRTYLEVERFDRSGSGRIGVTSLMAIAMSRHAELDNWVAAANRLYDDDGIDARTLEQVRLVATFGELIANTDRHFGNLAFYDDYRGRFTLAPIYDMLPMLFAPQNDQIVQREFVPPNLTANSHRAWGRARELAQHYWRGLTDDARISDEFRGISAACLAALQALPVTGAYAQAPPI